MEALEEEEEEEDARSLEWRGFTDAKNFATQLASK